MERKCLNTAESNLIRTHPKSCRHQENMKICLWKLSKLCRDGLCRSDGVFLIGKTRLLWNFNINYLSGFWFGQDFNVRLSSEKPRQFPPGKIDGRNSIDLRILSFNATPLHPLPAAIILFYVTAIAVYWWWWWRRRRWRFWRKCSSIIIIMKGKLKFGCQWVFL